MEIIISIMNIFKSMETDKLLLREQGRKKRAQDNTRTPLSRSLGEKGSRASDARRKPVEHGVTQADGAGRIWREE